jgi:hypothetical protein
LGVARAAAEIATANDASSIESSAAEPSIVPRLSRKEKASLPCGSGLRVEGRQICGVDRRAVAMRLGAMCLGNPVRHSGASQNAALMRQSGAGGVPRRFARGFRLRNRHAAVLTWRRDRRLH